MRGMIERVAAVLKAQDNNMAASIHHYEAMARAAIAAMREPTDAMMEVGQMWNSHRWQAMIDAALEEK